MLGRRGKAKLAEGQGPAGEIGGASATPAHAALLSRNAELEQQKAALERDQGELRRENQSLREENQSLRGAVATLEAKLRDLMARIGQNSRNSSRPPSTDPPSVPRRRRREGPRRKPGGQPGHAGHSRPLVPPEQVDHQVACYPAACDHCHASLAGGECAEAGAPLVYQVHDVEIRRQVTQYDQHRLVCPQCGESTLGALPAEVACSQYGPGLTALVAVLSGVSQLARREVSRLCSELCGVPVSVGSVQKLCEQVSAAVAAPVDALAAAIRKQPAVGIDETGWRVKHKRRFLWVVHSALGSIFKVGTRAAEVGKGLLGPTFAGRAMTDRYAGHDWIPAEQRQLCWAHLDRDAQALIDLGVPSAMRYGEGIHRAAKAIFQAWQNFQAAGGGAQARLAMRTALEPAKERLRPLLLRGKRSRTPQVVKLCKAMESAWVSLWLFVDHEGIEPTNNGSERAVRKAVQWRKKSLGTHSDEGAAFVERMLAVTATCRRQQRSPLAYLTEAAVAMRSGQPAPSLLPPSEPAGGNAGPESASLRKPEAAPTAPAPAPDAPAPTAPAAPAPVAAAPAPRPGLARPVASVPATTVPLLHAVRSVAKVTRRKGRRPRRHALTALGASP